jgi:hypothetical protein
MSDSYMMVRIALGVCAMASFAAPISAQSPIDPVTWTTNAVVHPAPGAQLSVTLLATIAAGWHIYSLTQPLGGPVRTSLRVPAGQPFTLADSITADEPATKFDSAFGMTVESHEESVEFTVPLNVDTAASPGLHHAEIKARYQACNTTICYPAKTVTLSVDIHVTKPRNRPRTHSK